MYSICAFSQSKHEDGPFKEYHKKGNLKTEGVYKNDKKVGLWKDYYESGPLKKENVFMPNGKWTGYKRLYSKDGILSGETKPDGNGSLIEKHYFDNGDLKREFLLVASNDGKRFLKAGEYKEFYENDSLNKILKLI